MNVEPLARPRARSDDDRRLNLILRERFSAAQALLAPLLSTADSQNGTAFYRAMIKLQNAYPDLSDSEIEVLVAEVLRTYQSRSGKR